MSARSEVPLEFISQQSNKHIDRPFRFRRRFVAIAALALAVCLSLAFSQQLLWWMGSLLVDAEPPQKADIEIVLGGDYSGNRIMKGCEVLRAGLVPRALVSGSGLFYGEHESVLAIRLATARGCPSETLVPFKYPANSTADEAAHLIPELHRLNSRKVLLVTSPSHTARAARIFRRLAPEIEFHAVASIDRRWNNGYWWKTREGRKVWLLESVKTIAGFMGL